MNKSKKTDEKIVAKKLVLSRETLRALTSGELTGIVAGVIVTTGGSYNVDC